MRTGGAMTNQEKTTMRCDPAGFACVCRAEFYTASALHPHQAGCAIAAEHDDDAVRALEDRDVCDPHGIPRPTPGGTL